jgi:hypothetical protein
MVKVVQGFENLLNSSRLYTLLAIQENTEDLEHLPARGFEIDLPGLVRDALHQLFWPDEKLISRCTNLAGHKTPLEKYP